MATDRQIDLEKLIQEKSKAPKRHRRAPWNLFGAFVTGGAEGRGPRMKRNRSVGPRLTLSWGVGDSPAPGADISPISCCAPAALTVLLSEREAGHRLLERAQGPERAGKAAVVISCVRLCG
jgi:hypothetical protein